MPLSITFHGAAGMVTGSKHLLELPDGKRVLLDCGMFQGEGPASDALNRRFGFDPQSIDALVLSHAHIDHSGLIPRLVAEGFRGPIFATPATLDLCEILLADSAYIQENDFRYDVKRAKKQRRAMTEIGPLYTAADVDAAMTLFSTVQYDTPTEILPGLTLTFIDAGHILGSASVHLTVAGREGVRRITFSGDVGRYVDRLLPDPKPFPQADVIICESTYGDRDHPEAGATWKELLGHVQRVCVEQHGRLIIPAFSVGRTQEILYALNHLFNEGKLPRVPVFVDSPLSINATGIYRKHSDLLQADIRKELETDPDLFGFQGVEFIREAWRSKELNTRKGPSITIAASGMMDAGRIRHHLLHGLPDANNAVLIVGFCAPGTFGERLLQRPETVKLYGEVVPVRAAILSMDSYSAHGDRNELLRWIACQEPTLVKHVFLVHGSDHALEGLRDRYAEHGFRDIQIPELGQRFEV
ncbi:MAG: MBL fold metallo-hydrolase [Flavobacteriales bacterium]|nr:MBL fold metallo-hydrolase [Flavobacteriales bacterium]MBK7247431.1 MBL fold metallo-hydrolase [Flavobacteriales bacterium]MBK7286360.1 MBL fold metallo-hydrolase [Flavobacteriales bacterium]MBK9061329.1 MBL fold metallo-hydrolase [Flavobacteriales bacterium]MBK9596799.1 MBL fold metallo-hydrolase [Flavobacteriales bacterium]